MDQPIIHGHIPPIANTMSVDIRTNDVLNYAMASYANDALNGKRYGQKYRPSFETGMSHQRLIHH